MTDHHRPRFAALIALVAVAAVAASAASAVLAIGVRSIVWPAEAASVPALPDTGHMIQRFTAANMAGHFTGGPSDAIGLARAYDVIVGTDSQFTRYLGAMRAANPRLVVLGYVNGTFAQKSQSTAYPASWYLHDAAGRKVTSKGFGNYAMDPSNSGWVGTRVQACAQFVSQGYDGCMLDMLGSAPTQPGYLTALPIDPATGRTFTAAEWLAGAAALGQTVAQSVAPRLVIGNGLGDGTRYFDPAAPSSQLFSGIRGAIAEAWLKSPGAPASQYPTEAVWKQNVDALVSAGSRGDVMVTLTKTWGGGTKAQIDAWHLFSLASFLLGSNGSAYYEFSAANSQAGIMFDSPWEHVNVGSPLGPYAKVGDVYQRSFSLGLAVVNPTSTASAVTLAFPMCDVNGRHESTATLGPDGAEVFYRC